LEAFAAQAYQVLLQTAAEDAALAARKTLKIDILLHWCLVDNASDDLLRTLDIQRGLLLNASGTSRSVASRLRALGEDALADEWESTGGGGPLVVGDVDIPGGWGDLRRKVLSALTGPQGGFGNVVDPPDREQIQSALRATGSDALVYLVAEGRGHPGIAVVVPSAGKVEVLTLPNLVLTEECPVSRYADIFSRQGEKEWTEALDQVCDWAWEAAGCGLVARFSGSDSPPRLVLVSLGALGLVPWHAARRTVEGRPRYLVEDIVLSAVPSARMLCDVVARNPVDTGTTLIVGNPARDLVAGAVEAAAIRNVFYPDAVLMGSKTGIPRAAVHAEGGKGTLTEVTGVLAGPVPLLHLACHADVDILEPLRSRIRLAGPDGDLTTRRLLEVSDTADLHLGQVTLAGCTTHLSGADYDEALTLSSALLAIGARTVVGSLWATLSRPTAHMMFVMYDAVSRGAQPVDALRAAQLWMLDPDRALPESAPQALRNQTSPSDYTAVETWAAFTHLGQ
jgi:hypothetical protein